VKWNKSQHFHLQILTLGMGMFSRCFEYLDQGLGTKPCSHWALFIFFKIILKSKIWKWYHIFKTMTLTQVTAIWNVRSQITKMILDCLVIVWYKGQINLCVMENKSCAEQWMVEGAIALKKGLCNWRWKVR
jgi:hypothetical protein